MCVELPADAQWRPRVWWLSDAAVGLWSDELVDDVGEVFDTVVLTDITLHIG